MFETRIVEHLAAGGGDQRACLNNEQCSNNKNTKGLRDCEDQNRDHASGFTMVFFSLLFLSSTLWRSFQYKEYINPMEWKSAVPHSTSQ